MGLSSALNTSLNGLALNETTIDVLGNNIANAGTNGFKSSEVIFATQLARTISVGSTPTATNGGTNPKQIGLGASTSQIRRDFTQGSITNTASPSDLAIQGDGFFVVNSGDGPEYTRAGNFSLNSSDVLVSSGGLRVQGYGVDDDFNLITTQLVDLVIPLGDLNVAQATRNIVFTGALFSGGTVSTQGSVHAAGALYSDALATTPAVGTDTLVSLFDAAGNADFQVGDVLSFSARKGGRQLPVQTLTVTATTSVNELLAMMNDALGISVPGGGTPAAISGTGVIGFAGNAGEVNDLTLISGGLTRNRAGTVTDNLIDFTKTQAATAESSITDYIVYDSLGQEVRLKLTTALVAQDSTSTTFRYFIEEPNNLNTTDPVDTGLLTFDSNGQLLAPTTANFTINRVNQGADDIVAVIDFSKISGISTQAAGSAITLQSQDGSAPGNLTTYVIDEGGVINGIFDNGIIRNLGQIVLARFSNPQGLLDSGDTNYREGISSGPPFITTPGNFGAGTVRSGAVELSNTDIGKNLVNLIVASTNYRGNARVIDSVQQLVDELLILGR